MPIIRSFFVLACLAIFGSCHDPMTSGADSVRPAGLPVPAQFVGQQATDPVCHMSVAIKATTPWTNKTGTPTFFCSRFCRDKFNAHPKKFMNALQ